MARRLFLERRTYRQNRLQDAARLLPVLGLVLVFAPIFIRGEAAGDSTPLSGWLIYYFSVWIVLIALTGFVSRALQRAAPDPGDDSPESGKAASGAGGGDAQL